MILKHRDFLHRYSLILCLYDVVGSFADERSNAAILRNVARHLAPDGHAVLTVANFNYRGRRRYTAGEIETAVKGAGLKVVRREFVRAGFAPRPEIDGKEILVIARR